ncbi:hypothetical protein [uncultured Alistipes sp.]|uniref:hypothetical protein n=1 Tax=uncultured Alistipes sp. TaxID=538949 RepID=UPI0026105E77|nr:hypothetical protein [uncultured Alistipes sp.]
MKHTPSFVTPVLRSTQSKVASERWGESIEAYDEGRFVEALHLLIDFLNPEFRTRYGNAAGDEFHIPHGSIVVDILIGKERLEIGADFLSLPAKGRVAMLRQVADLSLNKLMLPSFRLRGEKLRMEYACPLSQTHPHKIYHILSNICSVGDRYDDEFCTKFGAQRCYEPRVTPYPAEEMRRVVEAIRTTCRDCLKAVKEYEANRQYGYAWNVIDTAFYQISYFAQPQGQLLNELDKAVDDMDRELPVAELTTKGRAVLEHLASMSDEELAADLYFVDMLVSPKRRSSLANVQENMKDVYEEATQAIEARNFERAAVRILYKFYEMYFYNDVQDDLNAVVVEALKEADGESMEDAAQTLYDALERIMEDDLESDDDDEDDDECDEDEETDGEGAAEEVAVAIRKMQGLMRRMMGLGKNTDNE